MRVTVTHDVHDLSRDFAAAPAKAARKTTQAVRKNIRQGNQIARRIARAKAGPHGKAYYKRLTEEMTGVFEGEYGPEGDPKTEFVGAGWRHGVNLDLPDSADIIGPRFARDVGEAHEGLIGE